MPPSKKTKQPPAPAGGSASSRRLKHAEEEAPPDRRKNILLAAEKLFAERGYHAVSIRDIASEADVPLGLVGYYYGPKPDLYHAIFESWSGTMQARRAGLEQALKERSADKRLTKVIEAFVEPLAELHRHPEGQNYAKMAARDLAAPTPESERAAREFFDPAANAFIDALQTTAPAASRGQIAWCYQFMLGALLHHLSDIRVERLSGGENKPADSAGTAVLLKFIGAGMRAVLGVKPSR